MSRRWKELALKHHGGRQGFAEYAFEKADMFARRSDDAVRYLAYARTVDIKEIETPRILDEPSLYNTIE